MDDELKDLIKKNNEMLEEILKVSKKTKFFIISQQIFSVLKILLIIVPLVLGIIYLDDIVLKVIELYKGIIKDLIGVGETEAMNSIGSELIDTKEILKQLNIK